VTSTLSSLQNLKVTTQFRDQTKNLFFPEKDLAIKVHLENAYVQKNEKVICLVKK
jgi:hypothetical protein